MPSSRAYTPLADEVNPPFGNAVTTVTRNGTVVYGKRPTSESSGSSTPSRQYSAETTPQLASRVSMTQDHEQDLGIPRSAKGKERAWDPEMGQDEIKDDTYPPGNENAEEERRVADTLARFAARDAARRRAARLSKQLPPSPQSTSSGFLSRPFSVVERQSLRGLMENITGKHPSLPTTQPKPYNDPYSNQPYRDAGLDPFPRDSISSAGSSPGVDTAYGYAGPAWRGGAPVQVDERAHGGGEKWWHALCAWGDDLDGGHAEGADDQAGRTNPFE
ncbi:hypothetical protein BD324DRAFT_648503 [Kockovaella imperatae]|uniref:Uncharacterized protein n=1 Tax=Kockovaella imperatae TaxID=4999 RepID=A0A1Y1UPC7_9TREE|nr:hypothetical protein BD324DRAFT_648503 [Kockovaella imperatae]ORX39883.1 hypothetical protein BD324DRAFT_648503 [Kockovaella imperatae]